MPFAAIWLARRSPGYRWVVTLVVEGGNDFRGRLHAPSSMATALNIVVYPLRSGLLWESVVPVYHRLGADVGRSFFFEQRIWLQHLGVSCHSEYRKREKKEGYISKCLTSWALGADHFCPPSGGEENIKTNTMSTSMLLAWLLEKYRHFEKGREIDKMRRCSAAVEAWCLMAQSGFAKCDAPLEIDLMGLPLRVDTRGRLNLSALVHCCPELPGEWETLRSCANVCGLSPWPASHAPQASDVLRFLAARMHYSPTMAPVHWMYQFRNSLLLVLTFAMELEVASCLATERNAHHTLNPMVVRSGRGWRQCRRGALSKLQILQKLSHTGSNNTIAQTICESHGYAAVARNVSNGLYNRLANSTLARSSSLSLSWDGATYSGLNVNIMMGLDCQKKVACHLKPGVVGAQSCAIHLSCLVGPWGAIRLGSQSTWSPGPIETHWFGAVLDPGPWDSQFVLENLFWSRLVRLGDDFVLISPPAGLIF